MRIEVLPEQEQGAISQAGCGTARPAIVGKDGALGKAGIGVQVEFEVDVDLFLRRISAIKRHRQRSTHCPEILRLGKTGPPN